MISGTRLLVLPIWLCSLCFKNNNSCHLEHFPYFLYFLYARRFQNNAFKIRCFWNNVCLPNSISKDSPRETQVHAILDLRHRRGCWWIFIIWPKIKPHWDFVMSSISEPKMSFFSQRGQSALGYVKTIRAPPSLERPQQLISSPLVEKARNQTWRSVAGRVEVEYCREQDKTQRLQVPSLPL